MAELSLVDYSPPAGLVHLRLCVRVSHRKFHERGKGSCTLDPTISDQHRIRDSGLVDQSGLLAHRQG
jgi:hypothetical protein